MRLDATIAQRQARHMGHGVAYLDVLATEIAYFEARGTDLAAIVSAAERSAGNAWDGDTQEMPLNDE